MGIAGHHVPVWYDESSGPASGQVMSWNAATGRWEATDIDTAAIDTAGLATDAELAAGLATKQDTIPPGTFVAPAELDAEEAARIAADATKAPIASPTLTGTTSVESVRIKTERFDIRHPAWAGSLDGVANNVTAINAIQASALSASGGELYFGPGVAGIGGSGVLLTRGNMTWKGAGMWVSTIKALAGATGMIGSSAAGTLVFEDLAFDGSDLLTILLNLGGNRHQRVTFRRCRFFGLGTGTAIVAASMSGYEFIDCLAHAPGTGDGRFLTISTGGSVNKVRGLKVRYLREGIIVATGNTNWENNRQDFLAVSDFDCDLGWWLLKAQFSGEGGTVTYANPAGTQVVVTDSAAAISGVTTAAGSETNIRVMPVRATGTHNAVNTWLPGTGFNASGIKRGDIVRCGTAFAVVQGIESDTVVRIEEWLSQTTYLPVAPPVAGTAWTVYGSLIGRVSSFTATTVTIDRLHDVDGTTVLLPDAGTRYEILYNRPNYPFQTERGAYGVQVRDSIFRRGWSDQIAFQGARACGVSNSIVADGQDMGITLDQNSEDCSIQNVLALHNGAGGIYSRGAYHQIVNNRGYDNHWQNPVVGYVGDFMVVGLTGGIVAHNIARRRTPTMGLAAYGFVARSGGGGALIARNQAEGHATAGFRMDADSGAHKWRDNDGTYSIAGTVAHTFGTLEGTGSPEAAVVGSIGDTYRRRDGGAGTSTYVKESGNGTNTGWVAK